MKPPKNKYDFTAAVLAGGKNTRFYGETKANIIINGRPLIERTLDILQDVFSDVIIITNSREEFKKYDYIRMAGDIYHNIGPLGGLHSALTHTEKSAVFLVASDMPELSASTIRHVAKSYEEIKCEALIPVYKGHIEPLHAIYDKSLLSRVEGFIKSGTKYSMKEFLHLVNDKYVEIEEKDGVINPFLNINSPEDLQKWY
ncbi:MAG: molybdenum cofactor guanylyltransferase [Bacteroidota bacterium]